MANKLLEIKMKIVAHPEVDEYTLQKAFERALNDFVAEHSEIVEFSSEDIS